MFVKWIEKKRNVIHEFKSLDESNLIVLKLRINKEMEMTL